MPADVLDGYASTVGATVAQDGDLKPDGTMVGISSTFAVQEPFDGCTQTIGVHSAFVADSGDLANGRYRF